MSRFPCASRFVQSAANQMLETHPGPFSAVLPPNGFDSFDPGILTRLLCGEDVGSDVTLLPRMVEAVRQGLRAGAARFWSPSAEGGPTLTVVTGVPVPFTEPVRVAATARRSPIGNPATCTIVRMQDSEPREAANWGHQHGLGAAVLLNLVLNSREYGCIELFSSQPPGPAAIDSLKRWSPWLALIAAYADCRRRVTSSQDLAHQLVRASPAAIIGLDSRGCVRLWSPAAERLFGLTATETVKRPLRIVPSDRRSEAEQVRTFVLSGKSVPHLETVRQRADGSPVEVALSAVPQFDSAGNVVGTIEILNDRSGRQRATRHLQIERRILDVLEISETVDQAGPPALQALCEALGWRTGELWLVDRDNNVLVNSAIWSRFRSETAAPRSHCRPLKRGEGLAGLAWEQVQPIYFPVIHAPTAPSTAHHAPLEDLAGFALPITYRRQVLGIIAFQDVLLENPSDEERLVLNGIAAVLGQFLHCKQTEEALSQSAAKLRQAQKMDAVGLLAGGIAHDFNNVLTVILSYSEIAAEEVETDHPAHGMLVEIHNAGRRAASMTRRLLTFSRQHNEELVPLNLNQMVGDMERMLRRLIGPNITLDTSLEPALGTIRGDASQIDQVLVNFVVNARDAIGDKGAITIATRHASFSAAEAHVRPGAQAGDFVVLSVRDTGCGMDDATKQRIFEPFFTTKGVGRGTGMGLATVAGIVQQAGGFVEVETAPGMGTEMIVYFPRIPTRLATSTFDSRPEPVTGGRETVVVVEDDEVLRTLIRRVIQVRGYRVFEAANASDALRIVSESREHVSLVLTNLSLRGERGDRLAAQLRDVSPQTKVILVMDSGEEPGLVPEQESSGVLHKPFTSDGLARKIRAVLDS